MTPKLAHTIDELSEASTLGRSAIYEDIKAGKLRVAKRGRRTIVLDDDARAWLESLRIVPAE